MAARAAKSKPNRELADVKDHLRAMIDDVHSGTMDRSDAAVCGQLYNTLIRAVSVELKIREVEDLEERIEQIEAAVERQQNKRWGRSSV